MQRTQAAYLRWARELVDELAVAGELGALLPMLSSRLGIDPAVVSAPLVTTLVDAIDLLIHFGIAQLLVL